MKRAAVIYDSRYGNTEKISMALARGLEKQSVKVDRIKVDGVDLDRLAEYDLLAIGGPTHRRHASETMENLLEQMRSKKSYLRGKKAFAFDTRRDHWLAGSAADEIEKTLKGLGMTIVRPHSSAIIAEAEEEEVNGEMKESKNDRSKEERKEQWHRTGRLRDGMLEMFEEIGIEIAKEI